MIRHLHNKLISKEFSATELTKQYLERIEKFDQKICAFLTVTAKSALDQARAVDEKIACGEKIGLLAGLPAAIKDNIATRGVKTTAASRILENYVPPFDATVIELLRARDFVMLGKTNLDEFAHGSSTENSAFWTTRNPWDLTRVPGGSSGGSAAAVVSGMAVYALGTDTGGSIRQPASYCGLVGLKPTYGLCSRYGLIAMTSSTDVPGFLTKRVEDAAYLLSALAGRDPKDATTLSCDSRDYLKAIAEPRLNGVRIGIPKEYFIEGLNKEVLNAVKGAVRILEKEGAIVKEISLPHSQYGIAVYYIVTPSEVSSNLGRFDGIRYGFSKHSDAEDLIDVYYKSRGAGFGQEAKRRIMIGTYALSSGYYDAYYKKAQKVRTLIIDDFKRAFREVDVIITPTAPDVAFKIGSKENDPLAMYLEDIFSVPVSLAGLPAISIPCGFNHENLPIGMQIIGPQLGETILLKVAAYYEGITDWHTKEPMLLTEL
ncbi:MAG: Glutamyl-tRNA(Gln) amidotransferase subunit A [Parcubacteria group bacterium GW2011_GWF2_44_17]|nr:MAG: Glutamyl-tRNA(Gln) amidotransferase subunit A [Parcubacteria group bacterium GW2011_GWF2_44_17]HCA67360.1 Asp-tRNA(Asn)/Glu-tRNA(Gln) amidotransferase GatCAB subunit A [Candidatus Jacksonbacteria bacterium]